MTVQVSALSGIGSGFLEFMPDLNRDKSFVRSSNSDVALMSVYLKSADSRKRRQTMTMPSFHIQLSATTSNDSASQRAHAFLDRMLRPYVAVSRTADERWSSTQDMKNQFRASVSAALETESVDDVVAILEAVEEHSHPWVQELFSR